MKYLSILALCGVTALSACSTGPAQTAGSPRLYRVEAGQEAEVTYRMLDSVNSLRQARGLAPLQLNAALNAAAATHSRDMAVQNRPWHFGSDGSSPLVRATRAGYSGTLLGEDIAETYQTEIETLGDWMKQVGTREVVLNPAATDMGFAWFQESSGKLWWTIVTGAGGGGYMPQMAMAQ